MWARASASGRWSGCGSGGCGTGCACGTSTGRPARVRGGVGAAASVAPPSQVVGSHPRDAPLTDRAPRALDPSSVHACHASLTDDRGRGSAPSHRHAIAGARRPRWGPVRAATPGARATVGARAPVTPMVRPARPDHPAVIDAVLERRRPSQRRRHRRRQRPRPAAPFPRRTCSATHPVSRSPSRPTRRVRPRGSAGRRTTCDLRGRWRRSAARRTPGRPAPR